MSRGGGGGGGVKKRKKKKIAKGGGGLNPLNPPPLPAYAPGGDAKYYVHASHITCAKPEVPYTAGALEAVGLF